MVSRRTRLCRRRGMVRMSVPSITMWPLSGRMRRPIVDNRVDFPQPLEPRRAIISPPDAWKSWPFQRVLEPKVLERFSTRNTGLFSFMVAVPFIVVMLRASSMFDRTCIGECSESRFPRLPCLPKPTVRCKPRTAGHGVAFPPRWIRFVQPAMRSPIAMQ